MAEMSTYERQAWAEVEHWRAKGLASTGRRFLPAAVRERAADLATRGRSVAEGVPGAALVEQAVQSAFGGLLGLTADASAATVRASSVISAYRKAGHEVDGLAGIRTLDLEVIDAVAPRFRLRYMSSMAAEGAVAGLVVSGGEILAAGGAIAGAGVGAAPGVGTVVAAMAADAVAVIAASNRCVAQVAAYYGYDVEHESERLFALGVLGFGTATGGAKVAAYAELNKLVHALVRNQTWKQLNSNVITRVVNRVYTKLGGQLTKAKLGQAVPAFGVVIGAGMNAAALSHVARDAELIYRERFLRDKYGLEPAHVPVEALDGEVIELAEIIEEELATEGSAD